MMGVQVLCDGCNAILEEVPPPHGIAKQTYYCEKCGPSVRRFEKQRDELHTNVSVSFTERLALMRQRWLEEHPGGRLPDQ
jgi:hypothetical protein